jgi:hypothetical protein
MVKSWQPQWRQVQLRFAWSDGFEMASFASDKMVANPKQVEVDRIYSMTFLESCVKVVRDSRKRDVPLMCSCSHLYTSSV